ncbi:MAG: hypothetical protein PHS14_09485 [Elusimicrobia bacterium]|nr:hypothetical protein [Elusimicrobiota bacterium]
MKIRFEVGRAKSPAWPHFLRMAKKQPGYRLDASDGLEVHVIETEDMEAAMAIGSRVWGWRSVDYYLDGRLVSRSRMMRILWDVKQRGDPLERMVREIETRQQTQERHRAQEDRWRMGLGPEPDRDP